MSPIQLSGFRQSIDAILMACTGWLMFCICDAMNKWLAASVPITHILGVSGIIGAAVTGGWIFFHHGWRGFMTPQWKWYLARGFSVLGASYFVMHAIARIPLADFYGIIFLTPMMTTLLAVFFLKETVGFHRIAAIIAGFAGVLIIVGPSFAQHDIGYAMALTAVIFTSLNGILIRKIGRESIIARYGFYPFLFNSMAFGPFALADFQLPDTSLNVALLFTMPLISMAGILLYSMGFARARDTAVVTPFHYTQMVWGALLGYVVFHDTPTLQTMTGSLIIVTAGLFVLWREHLHHRRIAKLALDIPV